MIATLMRRELGLKEFAPSSHRGTLMPAGRENIIRKSHAAEYAASWR